MELFGDGRLDAANEIPAQVFRSIHSPDDLQQCSAGGSSLHFPEIHNAQAINISKCLNAWPQKIAQDRGEIGILKILILFLSQVSSYSA